MQNVRISYRKPKLELYNTNKTRISILTDRTQLSAYNIVLNEKINEVSELTFTIPFENTKITYDDCEKLIKFENEFYIIKNISVNDSNSRMMDVTCYHESTELKGLVCEPIDIIGATVRAMYMKILSSTSQQLSGYAWGGTDIPVTTRRHLQSENENSFFENLLSMAKVFDARLEFKTDAFGMIRVYIKKEDINRGKYIKKGKDLKQLNIVYNSDEIFTRLTPYGATDSDGVELNILGVNNGKSYVEDYSYYLAKGMTMDEILKTPKCLQTTVSRYSEIVDAKDLLRIAKEELAKYCVPQLNGSISILDFSIFEDSVMTTPVIGERITIINKDINFKLYAKITGIERNYDNPLATKIQISNMVKYDSVLKDLVHQGDTIDRLTDKNGNITEGALKNPVSHIVADKASFNDLTANNITFDTATGNIMNLQTLLANHISGENGQFLNITTANTVIKDAVIKDAMIETVSADKINAGIVNTNNVHIQSENGGIVIADNTQQFKDKNGKVRIQMGQDAKGDFNFAVFDETGVGTLIDATGIKEKAIADGLIKNDMIGKGEIGGEKINISSLITEVNKDTNTNVIKSSKVQLDTENQTLDIAFKTLKTNVENIENRNLALGTVAPCEADSSLLNGGVNRLRILYETYTNRLKVGDKVTVSFDFEYTNLKIADGKNINDVNLFIQGRGNVTGWGSGQFPSYRFKEKINYGNAEKKKVHITYSTTIYNNQLKNQYWIPSIRTDYIIGGTYKVNNFKFEVGNETGWTPAPEDTSEISDKIQTNKTAIEAVQGKITTLISDTTIEKDGVEMKLKDAYSDLDQTVGKISGRVTSAETKFNNLQIGARNLLSGTKDWKDVWKLGTVLSEDHNYKGFSVLYGDNSRGTNYIDLAHWSIDVKPSAEYTLSFYAKGSGQIASYFYPSNIESGYSSEGLETNSDDGCIIHTLTGDWKRYWLTWKTLPSSTGSKNVLPMRLLAGTTGYICGVKFEEGNKATDWSPSPEEIDKSISSLSSRVQSAELKLEPDKIVTIVKNDKTNGVNTFALSSEVKETVDSITSTVSSHTSSISGLQSSVSSITQTTDAWIAKFNTSGGYNLVKNGGFKNGLAGWGLAEYHPNGTGRSIDVWNDSNEWILDGTHALCMRSTYNTTGEFRVDSQKFKVKQHTNYTISYLVSAHRLTGMGHYVRGNEWEILAHDTYQPQTGGKSRENWTRITHTFNTGNNHQISVNFFHSHTQHDAYSWITDVMINEGEVALPWSPHPTEIYEGSTMIDASGVTIKNGALKVENNSGTTMLQGDTSGTFYVKDGGVVVAGTATDVWNNRGYRTTLRKQGIDFNFDSDGGGYPPFHGGIYLDYKNGGKHGIVLDGIKTISGGNKSSVDVSGALNVSSRLGVSGDVVTNGDIHTSGKVYLNGGGLAPASWGNGGKWGSLCIDGANNGWAGFNFNQLNSTGMYQLVNDETFGFHDVNWLWRNSQATFVADGRHRGWVGGYEAYRDGGNFRISPSNNDGGIRFETFNRYGGAVGSIIFDGTHLMPKTSNGYILGYTSARWTDVYCTRGAFNGSDSKLKENIKPVSRNGMDKLSKDKEPTSIDLYNYIKDTGVYTFNYKNTTNNMLGVLADEIPDNVFNKIGIMTKTEEEYQNELQEQEEAKKILESTPMLIDEEENKLENTIVEGTELTYKELKENAEKTIEEPMRLINAPAQVAMLQEVLSIALNKIEALEQKNLELEKDLDKIKGRLGL